MRNNLAKAISALLVVNICVKLTGFGREMAIAHRFGATALTDAYQVAYNFPYFLQSILGYALVTAVVPILARYWREEGDNTEALRLGSTLLLCTSGGLLVFTLLGLAATPLLVYLCAPGFSAETAALTTTLTRIMFPSVLFMGSGLVLSGILNSRHHFVAAASAQGVANLFVIAGALLVPAEHISLLALATLIGYLFFLLIQLPDLKRSGFALRRPNLRHPALQQFLRNIIPITLGLAVNQVYGLINRMFASGMAEGSISALNYANKLMNLPLGLFVAAITTAIYPALAEKAQAQNQAGVAADTNKGLSLIMLCVVPAAAGLMALASPVIRLLFQSGSFDATATAATAQALLTLAPGLIFLAGNMLLIRVFYAGGDVKTPIWTGAIAILVNVAASFLLRPLFQHAGLGLANTLAAACQMILLYLVLNKRLSLDIRNQAKNYLKILAAALATAAVAVLVHGLFPLAVSKTGQALSAFCAITAACLTYVLVLLLLRTPLLREVWQSLRKS